MAEGLSEVEISHYALNPMGDYNAGDISFYGC
jgi:hypothetical protein